MKLLKSCRGAVTVFVTLLLIPSILVTGTGVDIARIYAARSLIQDANQLAANSALAEYDALLHDLYGLFAITMSDSELSGVVDEYIKAAFSETPTDSQENTFDFPLFLGKDPKGTLTMANGQCLSNPDVLRRQIEEYSALRAPIVVVKEVLERMDSFKKVKADSRVIDKKDEVDKRLDDVCEAYEDLYHSIKNSMGYKEWEDSIVDYTNDGIDELYKKFSEMKEVRKKYWEAINNDRPSYEINALLDHYLDAAKAINEIISGPMLYDNWMLNENPDDVSYLEEGEYHTAKSYDGIENELEKVPNVTEAIRFACSDVYEKCTAANKASSNLKKAVQELEDELNKGECSAELKKGITEPQEGQDKSLLEQYNELADVDFLTLANDFSDYNNNQANEFERYYSSILDGSVPLYENGYINISLVSLNSFYNEDMSDILDWRFQIESGTDASTGATEDALWDTIRLEPNEKTNPLDGYCDFNKRSPAHQNLYNLLEQMFGEGTDGKDRGEEKEKSKTSILAVFKAVKELFGNMFAPTPEGATRYDGEELNKSGITDAGTDFGSGGDWSTTDSVQSSLKDALGSDILDTLANAADAIGNKMLLLVYASDMFSCYSSGRGPSDAAKISMAGVTLGTDVDYFYQSEAEYIFHGDIHDAVSNINSVGSLIFLVRFIFDYIASFSIKSVNTTVNGIKASLSFLGPFAIAIGELARLALALGEAVTDLSLLRSGYQVAFIKNSDNWNFSLSGMADLTVDMVKQELSKTDKDAQQKDQVSDKTGMYYIDYLRIMLLFVDGDDMAARIANLIALNLTNYSNGLGKYASDKETWHQKMKEAEKYDLSKAITGFTITTSADLRLMFVPMGSGMGLESFGYKTVSETEYRGY